LALVVVGEVVEEGLFRLLGVGEAVVLVVD
jgi:hypothetical protein